MRVFVTGATGFVGTAIVQELLQAGHHVLGLARTEAAAASLDSAGAEVHRGSLDDPESLRAGALDADGVIHAAFIHDFSNYAASAEADKRAIETIGATLAGSRRPFVVTSGTLIAAAASHVATEDDPGNPQSPRLSESAALPLAERDVRVSVLRLPPSVHGDGDHGFVPRLIDIARAKGASGYVGAGLNRWAAVHRRDAARLFRIALEKAPAGTRLHAVGDEGVETREIAGVIGAQLRLPVVSVKADDAADHFGFLGTFFGMNGAASSALTEERFGWKATGPSLIDDLERGQYFRTSAAV